MAQQQKFSPAVDDLVNEGAYKVLAIATALEATGRKVVHLEIGQPDYPTPQHIVDAGVGALHAGQTTYTNPSGTLELREAIAARVAETRAVPVAADQVVVGPGAKPGLFFCTMALLSPGDEAVVPDPGFPTYANMVRACGGVTVPVPLTMGAGSTGSMYDMAALEAAVSAKTRLLVVCSPSNPTGGVISEADLARLAALAAKWPRLYVLSDEIYSELVYDLETAKDAADAPAAERPCAPSLLAAAHRMGGAEGAALVERIILLDGFSKTYCMTGWRLGFAPQPCAQLLDRLLVLLDEHRDLRLRALAPLGRLPLALDKPRLCRLPPRRLLRQLLRRCLRQFLRQRGRARRRRRAQQQQFAAQCLHLRLARHRRAIAAALDRLHLLLQHLSVGKGEMHATPSGAAWGGPMRPRPNLP